MSEQTITLKTVNDLRLDGMNEPQRYFIAAYQRGYRWTPLQVTQLLEDIREFTRRKNPQPEEFYCLQPLVLKVSSGGGYEVVDGQQRLTTLMLILRHFNERLAEKYQQKLFKLEYETRPNLLDFFDQPSEELAQSNADFFHLFDALRTIEEWFADKDSEVEDMKSAFLNKTKVIWFQLAESDNPVDAFTRLNVGKIPLTNDELIRALFLKRTSTDESESQNLRLQIAYEWDQLEKALQSDAFWYFVTNQKGKAQNRIGFLFELVAQSEGLPSEAEQDAYAIFYTFSQKLKASASPAHEWSRIKQTFMMLEEWFEDRVLYHVVGFLVSEGISVSDIGKLSKNCTKSEFELRLRQRVFRQVIGGAPPDDMDEEAIRTRVADRLEDLEYPRHRKEIKSHLLLFNLATLLQNARSNLRFQFDSFKNEQWDIEHVRSVASDKPQRYSDRNEWLGHCLGYLKSQEAEKELRSEIESFRKLPKQEALDSVFDPLYDQLLDFFKEKAVEEADNGIANLTLLDERTNRSYKNAVFAVKRQRILSLDQAGIFVPLCTRNVFLKCYSQQVDNAMFWSDKDRSAYQEVILETLVSFFIGKMEAAQ